jgi:hypothetical protein
MEFFLKELKFQNNNSDLKKHFPKSKKQRYFIKFNSGKPKANNKHKKPSKQKYSKTANGVFIY